MSVLNKGPKEEDKMICLKILFSEIFVSSLEREAGCGPLFNMNSITPNKKNIQEHSKVYSQIRRMEEQLGDLPQINLLL